MIATATSTIPGLLLESTDRFRKTNAFLVKRDGQWNPVSTDEFMTQVEELFHGLKTLGIQHGDRVAILSENRLEWAISDYAAQTLGAIVVPIYPTLSAAQIEYLLLDSEAKLLFVSKLDLFQKVGTSRKKTPALKYVIAYDPKIYQPGVMRLETLCKIGKDVAGQQSGEFRQSALGRDAEETATIIYTSGTTGIPKGVVLSHRNLVSNILATTEVLPIRPDDVELCFLPISHIFQRHVDYAAMRSGATIAYVEDPVTVIESLLEVRPTFVAGVPRFFEKIRTRILNEGQSLSIVRRAIFNWALRMKRRGFQPPFADRFIFAKIRQSLGGRLRFLVSGGAALEGEVADFFDAIGLPILEGYGLTETSPVIALRGKPVGDTEIRIADDGEILVRSSGVMQGYYRRPLETDAALMDGWFHTGDVGRINSNGLLEVTDRKKDLIVTSNGKKITPQPIENRLKMIPYFDDVVLIGDRRSYLSALIVPNMLGLQNLARRHHIECRDPNELLENREVHDLCIREIERRMQDLAEFERIRKIAFIPKGFSIEEGELTPTLKVRRSVIEEKFRARIDELYAA